MAVILKTVSLWRIAKRKWVIKDNIFCANVGVNMASHSKIRLKFKVTSVGIVFGENDFFERKRALGTRGEHFCNKCFSKKHWRLLFRNPISSKRVVHNSTCFQLNATWTRLRTSKKLQKLLSLFTTPRNVVPSRQKKSTFREQQNSGNYTKLSLLIRSDVSGKWSLVSGEFTV